MSGCVCVDGEFLAPNEAAVPALAHGVLYGDGVFETLRTYGGEPFRLDAHLDRLEAGTATLGIEGVPPPGVLAAWLREAAGRSGLADAMLRVTIHRGVGAGPDPGTCGPPTVVAAALPLRVPGDDLRSRGAHLRTVDAPAPTLPPPSVKSTSYQASVLARRLVAPADDALWVDAGLVRESTTANIFAVTDATLRTPPTDVCLPGVTRAEILDLAPRSGISVVEEPLSLERLLAADEVFVTNSLVEVLPVTSVDDSPVGSGRPGPATDALHEAYRIRTRHPTPAGGPT